MVADVSVKIMYWSRMMLMWLDIRGKYVGTRQISFEGHRILLLILLECSKIENENYGGGLSGCVC